jgi:hypothetical protein
MRSAVAILALVGVLLAPAAASADFGFLPAGEGFDATLSKQNGTPENRAGVHPFALRVEIHRKLAGALGDGDLRDLRLAMPSGFLLNATPVGTCPLSLFATPRVSPHEESQSGESCPDDSQIGVVAVRSGLGGHGTRHFGVFNVEAPYGSPLAVGFAPFGVPVVFSAHVREADAGLDLELDDLSQAIDLQSLDLTLWGTPWAHVHDAQRGNCLAETTGGSFGTCIVPGFLSEAGLQQATKSVLTLPTSCAGPLRWSLAAGSWQGATAAAEALSHNAAGQPLNLEACKNAATEPHVRLATDRAGTGTGLTFELEVDDGGGILNPEGIARPSIQTAEVRMPEGLTLNPSLGNGLEACTEAEFAREELGSAFGAGCPGASKVGNVEVEGMMGVDEELTGSLFVATPYANPFDSLLAVYVVASAPRRGLFVKATGGVELDPAGGRLEVSFEGLPRLLYTRFELTFREGQRPALVSPPACGTYQMQIDLRAWGRPNVLLQGADSFALIRGQGGGPCPAGAVPFSPGALAGSVSPQAGVSSPFYLNLTRTDAEQEITSYSAQLPPGVLGRIAGVPFCPDAAIAAAGGRSGTEELRNPSCPEASSIGRTLSGYGVGSVLAYAPGGLYLAGPYKGSPLSIVAIDAAVVGPFDLGTVVVRSAIDVDPRTAQVTIDSTASDPIPHILDGVPLHLRDIRVYVDRPGFTITPTSCERFSVVSTLTGSSAPFVNPRGATGQVTVPYRVLNCGALGFEPSFSLALSGGSKRGAHPQLRATFVPRVGDANVKAAAVTLPPSIFLDQRNIRDICTRAQAEADTCSAASVVGYAKAETPLMDEPLEGPVFLRSSSNPLPDLVTTLTGRGVRIVLEGRIDSHRGGIRARFEGLPDAPVSRFTMTIFGGRKRGLLVSAERLCRKPQVAEARFLGQAHLGRTLRPRLRMKCPKRKGGRGKAAKQAGKKRGARS